MPNIILPDYRDQNSQSRYPFADSATLVTTDGLTIPIGTLLDAALFPIGGQSRMFLSQVEIGSDAVVLTFSDAASQILCTGRFDPLAPPYEIPLLDEFNRPAGILISEPLRLSALTAWSTGVHTFALGAAELVASVCIPTPEIGLRGILTAAGELLTGEVWIVGDNGVVVRDDGDGNIRVDIVGEPLFRRKLCGPLEAFAAPRFITAVNGCSLDQFGNYQLVIGEGLTDNPVLRIYPTDDGLSIEAVGELSR